MKKKCKINLALQGGGSHGAYTWGILDRLLEEENLSFDGISGTSAGAMNGAVLVNGLIKDGREGAKKALKKFWTDVSRMGKFNLPSMGLMNKVLKSWNMDLSFGYHWFDILSRTFSPYDTNPRDINPLRDLLEKDIDMEMLREAKDMKLFVTATNVRTGRPRVFKINEISADVLLASACLPYLFQAVEVNGEHYWDGGYVGNPALWPLIYGCDTDDIILMQINPLQRHKLPKTAHEIMNRINEITFNSSLISEIKAINFVSRMVHKKQLSKRVYKELRFHMIAPDEEMEELNASSKLNSDLEFLLYLKKLGRKAAEVWIEKNYSKIGVKSSFDIEKTFFPKLIEDHPYIDQDLNIL
ncbi:MAG: patatin-like phospholipase family protein [Rickettsiales bacterium]|nr:patatin-like phospholipase family protein [Rickettsiales bacterium]